MQKITYILAKLQKIAATRAACFDSNMHQIVCRLGLRPRPHWGSLQRSPRPPSCIYGPTSKGEREWRRDGKGGDGAPVTVWHGPPMSIRPWEACPRSPFGERLQALTRLHSNPTLKPLASSLRIRTVNIETYCLTIIRYGFVESDVFCLYQRNGTHADVCCCCHDE